jgi:hypothetical protein
MSYIWLPRSTVVTFNRSHVQQLEQFSCHWVRTVRGTSFHGLSCSLLPGACSWISVPSGQGPRPSSELPKIGFPTTFRANAWGGDDRGPTAQLVRFDFADGPILLPINRVRFMFPQFIRIDGAATGDARWRNRDNLRKYFLISFRSRKALSFLNMDVVFVVQFISKFPAMHSG